MKTRFEDGRLPCSFTLHLLWEPVDAQLAQFDLKIANKKAELAIAQQRREEASQGAKDTDQAIKELQLQLITFQEAEQTQAAVEASLLAELNEWEMLDTIALKAFAQSAAKWERELVSQLESQLEADRDGLCALGGENSPKLSLLMNCFGAEPKTIRALSDLDSMNLAGCLAEEIQLLVSALSREQQIVVFYTQDRLLHGKLPFAKHDCALCDCQTPEEMAAFLKEIGLKTATADIIRKTGASGRGALLFLSTQDLQLGNSTAEQQALRQSRVNHRKR